VRRLRIAQALGALMLASTMTLAGPVEVYREGPRYCPREHGADAPTLGEADIVALARKLLPDGFCGPTRWVAGCDVSVEYEHGSWRVYLHQYRREPARHDWLGLDHTYVILDRVGNCLANIPGTPLGSYN